MAQTPSGSRQRLKNQVSVGGLEGEMKTEFTYINEQVAIKAT